MIFIKKLTTISGAGGRRQDTVVIHFRCLRSFCFYAFPCGSTARTHRGPSACRIPSEMNLKRERLMKEVTLRETAKLNLVAVALTSLRCVGFS
eukprot:SAG22_NODE_61_length_23387_cov_34.380582_22_plen_93_part_00